MIRRLAILLAVVLLLAAFTKAAPARQEEAAKISNLEGQERSIIGQLDRIDRQMAELGSRQRQLAAELKSLNQDEKRDRKKEAELSRTETRLRPQLARRIKALYLHGQAGPVRLALASTSLSQILFGNQALARIVKFDLQLIKDYNDLKIRLEETARKRQNRRGQIEVFKKRLEEAEAKLDRQRRTRASLLIKVDQEKQVFEEAVRELDLAAAALQNELAALEKAGPLGPPVGRLAEGKGRLPWPVIGRLKRMSPSRPGVLIRAREGSPVKAVGAGRVVYSGWVKGYGQVVIIDHGARYYTLSGHLEEARAKVGDEVEPRQVLGRLGRAGLAEPGVYFEIRHRDQALDPLKWLAGAGSQGS